MGEKRTRTVVSCNVGRMVMRYIAFRLRACRQSVPFNQSAQQTVWQPNSLIYKWYLFRESGHQNGFLPNGPFPKWSPPKFSTTTKFPFTFHNSAPFSSDKIRAKILDLGYGGARHEPSITYVQNLRGFYQRQSQLIGGRMLDLTILPPAGARQPVTKIRLG